MDITIVRSFDGNIIVRAEGFGSYEEAEEFAEDVADQFGAENLYEETEYLVKGE